MLLVLLCLAALGVSAQNTPVLDGMRIAASITFEPGIWQLTTGLSIVATTLWWILPADSCWESTTLVLHSPQRAVGT
jgi:hypothetical protein